MYTWFNSPRAKNFFCFCLLLCSFYHKDIIKIILLWCWINKKYKANVISKVLGRNENFMLSNYTAIFCPQISIELTNLVVWLKGNKQNIFQFSHSVMSDLLWAHESQHTRPPCPSPAPRIYSNSCPLSRWWHPPSHPLSSPSPPAPNPLGFIKDSRVFVTLRIL